MANENLSDALRGKFNMIVSGYRINADDAAWLYAALSANQPPGPAEPDYDALEQELNDPPIYRHPGVAESKQGAESALREDIIRRLRAMRGDYLGDGVNPGVRVSELIRALATPKAEHELREALKIHHEWSLRNLPGYSETGDERVAYRVTVGALSTSPRPPE